MRKVLKSTLEDGNRPQRRSLSLNRQFRRLMQKHSWSIQHSCSNQTKQNQMKKVKLIDKYVNCNVICKIKIRRISCHPCAISWTCNILDSCILVIINKKWSLFSTLALLGFGHRLQIVCSATNQRSSILRLLSRTRCRMGEYRKRLNMVRDRSMDCTVKILSVFHLIKKKPVLRIILSSASIWRGTYQECRQMVF